jgi:hypothetical protein
MEDHDVDSPSTMRKSCIKQQPDESSTSSSSNKSSSWHTRRRRVCFGRIEIKEHSYEMGDNPSVSDGAPLTIAWKSQKEVVFDVEYYEAYHPSQERKRKDAFKLSVSRRAEM